MCPDSPERASSGTNMISIAIGRITTSGTATRWAGVPATRRKDERRELLVRAAFELFGVEGEAGLSVRAVCRAAELNTRYFYENFTDTGELMAAVYDRQAAALLEHFTAAQE